ncbi:MAG: DUF4249 domain-containing protein [Bacteroidales bacterium]
MKVFCCISVFLSIVVISGCVKQFLPETTFDPDLIVVEGLITDQPGRQVVKISRSIPLGIPADNIIPVRRCSVWITDNIGNRYQLTESVNGTYLTDADFSGIIGRKYTLNIEVVHYDSYRKRIVDYAIQSSPVEMLPVPDIDSLYYEKVGIKEENGFSFPGEGSQVLLNTADPTGKCKYYRWDYNETWQIVTPKYQRSINRTCWVTNNSDEINAKTVTGLIENRIERLKVNFISNESDRLSERYRIQVNQYSLSEEEYNYWSDLEKITEQSGNFYDIIPSSVSGNMFCVGNNDDQQILGYFSVSAMKSKVLYIDEYFKGLVNPYRNCVKDTLRGGSPFPPEGIFDYDGILYWIVELNTSYPSYLITTEDKGCVDCTTRGTTVKPDNWTEAWEDTKKDN